MANDIHTVAFAILNEATESLWGVEYDEDEIYATALEEYAEQEDFWKRWAESKNYVVDWDDIESEIGYCVGVLFYDWNNPYE